MKDKLRVTVRGTVFVLFLLSFTSFIVLAGGESGAESTRVRNLITKADRVAREARTDVRTEDRLKKAIGLYQDVLELDPDNRHALNRLSLGYFTLAEAYLPGPKERKSAYQTGYKYGLRSLRQNEKFAAQYRKKESKALKDLPESVDDVEAVFWTGANLGRLGETKGVLNSLGDLPALIELNRRVAELDETYLGGAAHRTLGSIAGELLSRLPFTFWQVQTNGFSWDKVKGRFERAIELGPECLENYFSYAKYYALKKGKREMAEELLDKVLGDPLGEEYPLVNTIAKEKARKLKRDKF